MLRLNPDAWIGCWAAYAVACSWHSLVLLVGGLWGTSYALFCLVVDCFPGNALHCCGHPEVLLQGTSHSGGVQVWQLWCVTDYSTQWLCRQHSVCNIVCLGFGGTLLWVCRAHMLAADRHVPIEQFH